MKFLTTKAFLIYLPKLHKFRNLYVLVHVHVCALKALGDACILANNVIDGILVYIHLYSRTLIHYNTHLCLDKHINAYIMYVFIPSSVRTHSGN